MKTYKTLIKISKNELDEKRKELNIFLEKKDSLIAEKEHLSKELKKEEKLLENHNEVNFSFASYSANIRYQQENIDNFVNVLNTQIDELSKQISEKFSELKKYELMLDKKIADEIKEVKRKETLELDEISSNLHRRKNNTNTT